MSLPGSRVSAMTGISIELISQSQIAIIGLRPIRAGEPTQWVETCPYKQRELIQEGYGMRS